jgi:hypothetical protein
MSEATFPEGDDRLSRTLVFDHPDSDRWTTQILVSIYANGEIDVAERGKDGASWGRPWRLRELEAWS